jgi:hypothetical protein
MATKAQGNDCYEKARMEEPVFTLRAQDVLADLAVEFWVRANSHLRTRVAQGALLSEVRIELKSVLEGALPMRRDFLDDKLTEALGCAGDMAKWPNRKIAD